LSQNKIARKPRNIYRQKVGLRKSAGDTSLVSYAQEDFQFTLQLHHGASRQFDQNLTICSTH
jgi:hypothetical protein